MWNVKHTDVGCACSELSITKKVWKVKHTDMCCVGSILSINIGKGKGKGKVIPLQARCGPEGG